MTDTTITARATDTAGSSSDVLVLDPDGGEQLRFLGASTMRLKYDSGAHGDLAFYEYVSEPGVTGAPQHIHHGHDETFYVVDGLFEFAMGSDSRLLGRGGFVFVPRGAPHSFRNAGDGPGCLVGSFTPARFAHYFRELAAIIATDGAPPDQQAWTELYAKYDTTFHHLD